MDDAAAFGPDHDTANNNWTSNQKIIITAIFVLLHTQRERATENVLKTSGMLCVKCADALYVCRIVIVVHNCGYLCVKPNYIYFYSVALQ